ncbi:MAG: vWA domain-containing protein [Cyclobacteriaceae bacterium]
MKNFRPVLWLVTIFLSVASHAQIMCSNELGTFDYASIADHTIPFTFYYDVSAGTPVTSVDYFTLINAPSGCGLGTATATWVLTELNVVTGSVVALGNVNLSSASGTTTKVRGIPNTTSSPYRFEIKMTVGATDYKQQFIIYVTKPMSVSLVLDVSGSMGAQADPSIPGVTRLDVLKAGAGKFLNYFRFFSTSTTGITIADRVGVVYFTGSTTTFPASGILVASADCVTDPVNCVDNIIADINSKTPQNSTGMGKGVIEGLKQQASAPVSPIRNIVLFTDGIQNVPLPEITGTSPPTPTAFFAAGAAAADYAPGLPAGTLLSNVAAGYSDIKISTIGLAVSGSYFDNLNNISRATGGYFNGVPITKTADLDNAFLFNLTKIMRGGSPQIVDIARGNLVSGTTSTEFTINKNVTALVIDVVSFKNPEMGLIIEKDAQNVTSLGKIIAGNGYKGFSIKLPQKITSGQLLAEGKWTVKLSGQQNEDYKVTMIADDHALDYEGKIASNGKVSNPLSLGLNLNFRKGPIKDATVKALVLKPGQDLGSLLATTETKRGKDLPGTADLSAGNIKLQQLLQDPTIFQSLLPKEQLVTLTSNNDGTYSGSFAQTDVTGLYQVIFSIEGNGAEVGHYIRTEMQSTVLLLDDVVLNASSPNVVQSKDTLRISIRPKSVSGLYLGPDYSSRITVTTSAGKVDKIIDNVDGSYTIVIGGVPDGTDPVISLSVLDQKIYDGKASGLGQAWWAKYWWIWILLILILFVLYKILKK